MDFDDLEEGFELLRQLRDEEAQLKTNSKNLIQAQAQQLLSHQSQHPLPQLYTGQQHQQQHTHHELQQHSYQPSMGTLSIHQTGAVPNGSLQPPPHPPLVNPHIVQQPQSHQYNQRITQGAGYNYPVNPFTPQSSHTNLPMATPIGTIKPLQLQLSLQQKTQQQQPQQPQQPQQEHQTKQYQQHFSIIPNTVTAQSNPLYSNFLKDRLLAPQTPTNQPNNGSGPGLANGLLRPPGSVLGTIRPSTLTASNYLAQKDTIGAIKSPLHAALQSINQPSMIGRIGPISHNNNNNKIASVENNSSSPQPPQSPDVQQQQRILLQQSKQDFLNSISMKIGSSNQLDPTTVPAIGSGGGITGLISSGVGHSFPTTPSSTTPAAALPSTPSGTPSSTSNSHGTESYTLSLSSALTQKREKLREITEQESTLSQEHHLLQEQVHSNNLIVAKCERDVTIANYNSFLNEASPFEKDFIDELVQDYNQYLKQLHEIDAKISHVEVLRSSSTQQYNSLLEQINNFNLQVVNLHQELEFGGDELSNHSQINDKNLKDKPIASAKSLPNHKEKKKKVNNQRERYTQYIIHLQTLVVLESKVKRLVNQLMATTINNNHRKNNRSSLPTMNDDNDNASNHLNDSNHDESNNSINENDDESDPTELSLREKELLLLEEKEKNVAIRRTNLARLKADYEHYDKQQQDLMKRINETKGNASTITTTPNARPQPRAQPKPPTSRNSKTTTQQASNRLNPMPIINTNKDSRNKIPIPPPPQQMPPPPQQQTHPQLRVRKPVIARR